ncbi:MAG TPA: hypothetical protein VII96_11650, partial [Acidimicrobiales bacterium]
RVVLGGAAALAVVVPAVSLTPSASAGGTKLPDNPVAGYTVAGSGSGATTVTVPSSVTCTSPSSQAVSSGVVVSGSNSGATATVVIQCSKGSLLEYVFGTAGLAQFRFPVAAGDVVTVAAGHGSGATTASASDATSGVSESATAPGGTATGTLIGAASASKVAPTFASLSFTGSTIGLGSLGSVSPVGSDMVKGHATVVQTGALSLDGTAFTLTQLP